MSNFWGAVHMPAFLCTNICAKKVEENVIVML